MPNGRCRTHGGASTEPKTAAGLARIRKARTRHGLYSAAMAEVRQHCAVLWGGTRRMVEDS